MGKIIAVIGIDGSGKSTLINRLGYSSVHFYKKKRNLHSSGKDNAISKTKKRSKLRVFIGTLIKLYIYNILLYVYYKYFTERVLLFDRYSFDYYGRHSQKRDIYSKVLNYLFWNFPKPKYVFFLDVLPNIAFERKKEHDVDYLRKKRLLLIEALKNMPANRVIFIDSQKESEFCENDREIINLLSNKKKF